MVTVRYESAFDNFFTNPFEIGIRHLKVAFCNGSQDNLTHLAKERIIYRANEDAGDQFQPLTRKQRVFHALVGLGETVGYLTVVVPFVIAAVDKFFNKRRFPNIPADVVHLIHLGGLLFKTEIHTNEGGRPLNSVLDTNNRCNPFSKEALDDAFYAGATWITPAMQQEYSAKKQREQCTPYLQI